MIPSPLRHLAGCLATILPEGFGQSDRDDLAADGPDV